MMSMLQMSQLPIATFLFDPRKREKIRRGTHGGSKKSLATKSLWTHLELYHPIDYKEAR